MKLFHFVCKQNHCRSFFPEHSSKNNGYLSYQQLLSLFSPQRFFRIVLPRKMYFCLLSFIPLSIIMFRVTDHTRSGWFGFYRHRREKTKARQCLNQCGFENTQIRTCGISGCRKKTFEYRNVFFDNHYKNETS